MMSLREVRLPRGVAFVLREWRVRAGDSCLRDQILASFEPACVVRAPCDGIVRELLVQTVGGVGAPGLTVVARLEECTHAVVFNDQCCHCLKTLSSVGESVTQSSSSLPSSSSASSSAASSSSSSSHQAVVFGGRDRTLHFSESYYRQQSETECSRLLAARRLVLVLDIDHTLLHATSHFDVPLTENALRRLDMQLLSQGAPAADYLPSPLSSALSGASNADSILRYRIRTAAAATAAPPPSTSFHSLPVQPPKRVDQWVEIDARAQVLLRSMRETHSFTICDDREVHHIRLRPGVREFLETLAPHFDIYIHTKGLREYAEKIMRILDPTRRIFKSALCRDDVELSHKSLAHLLPCPEAQVFIVDDTVSVWVPPPSPHSTSQIHRNVVWVPRFDYWSHFSSAMLGLVDSPPPPPPISVHDDACMADTVAADTTLEIGSGTASISSSSCITADVSHTVSAPIVGGDASASAAATAAPRRFRIPKRAAPVGSSVSSATGGETLPLAGHASRAALDLLRTRVSSATCARAQQIGALLDAAEVADNVLTSVAQVLLAAHRLFFQNVDAELAVRPLPPPSQSLRAPTTVLPSRAMWLPHARHLLDTLRFSVLRGRQATFSGVFARNADAHTQYEFQIAQQFGMAIADDLTPECTHLVAAKDGSDKCRRLKRIAPGAHLVNVNWLHHSAAHFLCADESAFPLPLLAHVEAAVEAVAARRRGDASSVDEPAVAAAASVSASGAASATTSISTKIASSSPASVVKLPRGCDSSGRLVSLVVEYVNFTPTPTTADALCANVSTELSDFFTLRWATEKNRLASAEQHAAAAASALQSSSLLALSTNAELERALNDSWSDADDDECVVATNVEVAGTELIDKAKACKRVAFGGAADDDESETDEIDADGGGNGDVDNEVDEHTLSCRRDRGAAAREMVADGAADNGEEVEELDASVCMRTGDGDEGDDDGDDDNDAGRGDQDSDDERHGGDAPDDYALMPHGVGGGDSDDEGIGGGGGGAFQNGDDDGDDGIGAGGAGFSSSDSYYDVETRRRPVLRNALVALQSAPAAAVSLSRGAHRSRGGGRVSSLVALHAPGTRSGEAAMRSQLKRKAGDELASQSADKRNKAGGGAPE